MDIRLGIDLDNTIVCYDELFARLAAERSWVPPEVPRDKQAIRDYLRGQDRERQWTELQGLAYGRRMQEATVFPGLERFVRACEQRRIDFWIISHRTRLPCLGEPFDLHQAALDWLRDRRLLPGNDPTRIYLELSREAKISRIRDLRCNCFIDDLAEVLDDPQFPENVRRILFDPRRQHPAGGSFEPARSWPEIGRMLGI